MKRRQDSIYVSGLHLAATFALIAVPFVFLLVFSLIEGVGPATLMSDVAVSVGRLLVAYLVSVVLAWLAAVAFYRGRRATAALPIFDVLQSVPTFAALPLAVYVLGPSDLTVIVFLILAVVWPLFFSIVSSLKQMRPEWHDVARVTDLRGWHHIRYVLLPVTFPGFVTGSIVGLGDGWEALVATEIITGVRPGVGSFFGSVSHNTTATLFGILGLLLVVFTINKLIWLPLLERSHRLTED